MDQKKVTVDEYSLAATRLEMFFGDISLSLGTGFFWSVDDRHFLVTNWHNVTGINPRTGEHLHKHSAEPDRIAFDIVDGQNIDRRISATLYLRDGEGEPRWIEHPAHGRNVDVVCLTLSMDPTFSINRLSQQPLRQILGGDAFILGFPMGIGAGGFPIWKRASFASEPDVDVDDLPLLYVDSASSKAMSGAPVILRSTTGGAYMENGGYVVTGRTMTRFIGVYSGRLAPADQFEASLGLVWKADVVSEIIEGGKIGPKP